MHTISNLTPSTGPQNFPGNVGDARTLNEIISDVFYFTEIGEGIAIALPELTQDDKKKQKEPCRRIYIHAFRGARDQESVAAFKANLKKHEENNTSGPTSVECLLYTGHVGISFEAMMPIFGFNPDTGDEPGWKVIKGLKEKQQFQKPYPGIVTNDTAAFLRAQGDKLEYKVLELVYPESKYLEILKKFRQARIKTNLTYSFPGNGGDCNCATWPAKLGVQIPSQNGNMKEYIMSYANGEVRKLGDCCDD